MADLCGIPPSATEETVDDHHQLRVPRTKGGRAGLRGARPYRRRALEWIRLRADYPYAHVVRGALLEELGRIDEARASFGKALANTRNRHEVARIEARIRKSEIDWRPGPPCATGALQLFDREREGAGAGVTVDCKHVGFGSLCLDLERGPRAWIRDW